MTPGANIWGNNRIETAELIEREHMNHEAIIICQSLYRGNTRRLAKAMAYTLGCRVISTDEARQMDLSTYKVVGLGSGIYFTSHHPELIEITEMLGENQRAFVFSTRGAPMVGAYHRAMKHALKHQNVQVIGEFSTKGFDCTGPFILIGGGNKGRPNERDEQKAMRFVKRILPQYTVDDTAAEKGHFVSINQNCIACGTCVSVCPMQVFAFEEEHVKPTSELDCIHCGMCQRACPERAIAVRHGAFDAIRIAKRHAQRTGLQESH